MKVRTATPIKVELGELYEDLTSALRRCTGVQTCLHMHRIGSALRSAVKATTNDVLTKTNMAPYCKTADLNVSWSADVIATS